MRKIKILLIILSLFAVTACSKSDALKFKEEYESLNKEEGYRDVSVDKNNPFIYIEDTALAKKIADREDMVVYFGFSKCPWCRSILENLIKVSQDLKIEKIYYLDIYNIRDVKSVNEDGEVITEKDGSAGYNEIVQELGEHLSDYTVNETVVGKRIYAPNILIIKEGIIYDVITGLSDMQTDSKMELTDEIKKDSYNKIKELLSIYTNNSCPSTGC